MKVYQELMGLLDPNRVQIIEIMYLFPSGDVRQMTLESTHLKDCLEIFDEKGVEVIAMDIIKN